MPNNNTPSNSSISSEQYWNKHISLKRNSGLTRIEYCRKNNLKLSQFKYRERKLMPTESNIAKLLPLKLVSDEGLPKKVSKVVDNAHKLLCKLKLKDGGILKVYDINTLPIILNLLK